MGTYLGSVWRCRHFWLALVRVDLRRRYRNSVLGMGWSLLHPIAMTLILCVVFSQLLGAQPKEYAVYLIAGLTCWNFIVNVALMGCQSIFQGEAYIRQQPAPLAIYPLRIALGETIHFLTALAVALALAWWLNGPPGARALLSLPVSLVLLFTLGWSLAIITGLLNVYFQDTQHLCDVSFKLLFYVTPIIYNAQLLRGNRLSLLIRCNPLVPFLDLIRQPIVTGQPAAASTYAAAAAVVLACAGVAILLLARCERRLIFHL